MARDAVWLVSGLCVHPSGSGEPWNAKREPENVSEPHHHYATVWPVARSKLELRAVGWVARRGFGPPPGLRTRVTAANAPRNTIATSPRDTRFSGLDIVRRHAWLGSVRDRKPDTRLRVHMADVELEQYRHRTWIFVYSAADGTRVSRASVHRQGPQPDRGVANAVDAHPGTRGFNPFASLDVIGTVRRRAIYLSSIPTLCSSASIRRVIRSPK